MKYRRNVDSDLRTMERIFSAEPSLENLERYNVGRLRSGLPLFQEESLENLEHYNYIRVAAGLAPLHRMELSFGYLSGLPEALTVEGHLYSSTTAAWGARGILERNQASLLGDRQSVASVSDVSRQTLMEALNGDPCGTGAIFQAQREIGRLCRRGIIDPTQSREVVLYDDNIVRIVANTNASHGYLYMVCFLKPAGMETNDSINKNCEKCLEELDLGEELKECCSCYRLICPRCGILCPDCKKYTCEDHKQTECKSCGEVICGSEECNRRGGPSALAKECPKCGEMYCRECRAEVKNCPCADICEDCGEEVEECVFCGGSRCSCKRCPCEEEEDEEDEDEEEEEEEEEED